MKASKPQSRGDARRLRPQQSAGAGCQTQGAAGQGGADENRQNTVSKEIPKLKKAGEDTSAIMAEMKELSASVKELDGQVAEIEKELREVLLGVPNNAVQGCADRRRRQRQRGVA